MSARDAQKREDAMGAAWSMHRVKVRLFCADRRGLCRLAGFIRCIIIFFEANGVDAAFINMSVPASKMEFTLQNLGQSQFEALLVDSESANLPELLSFFGKTDGYISKIYIKRQFATCFCTSHRE